MEGAKLLGLLIGRDVLLSLQELVLSYNKSLSNEGVAYLMQGLQGSSKVKLHSLCLNSVGMGDAGLKSLAEAVGVGALLECRKIDVNANPPLRDIIPFSCALRCGGLKNLTFLAFHHSSIEPEAVTVLSHSLFEHCPNLNFLHLPKVGSDPQQVITEIRNIFEREGTISVAYH